MLGQRCQSGGRLSKHMLGQYGEGQGKVCAGFYYIDITLLKKKLKNQQNNTNTPKSNTRK